SAKTVAAFLNSELFQFFYSQTFASAKVLKSELAALPFPALDSATNRRLERRVDAVLTGATAEIETLNAEIFRLYRLDDAQIERIRRKNREK
ncbi:MAG: hypothetical protein IIY07_06595, partial [Thermoguttaceae bacterium]|nr:hypothetical protein [Thermoguttaceae bacterium]